MFARFLDWFLRVWGQAVGWSLGFSLALAALMVGMGLILLTGAFLGWAWDVFFAGKG